VADQNVLLAVLARRDEFGGVWVVQVVEDHHAGVLGTAELVELVVVALYAIRRCEEWRGVGRGRE
jgi:hypothetical protein